MSERLYRIEFSVQVRDEGDEDFEEIGFGSSTGTSSVDMAGDEVLTQVQRREWETSGDMPDPKRVDRFDVEA